MDEAMTTSQISYALELSFETVVHELVPMHQFGIVEAIGIRCGRYSNSEIGFYGLDVLWQTTVHTREHNETHPDCHGCWVREQLLLTEIIYE